MDREIAFDLLPELPQADFLHQLLPTLWQRQDVEALWLEGSLGRGAADLYSDIDLYVCVSTAAFDDWRELDVAALFGDVYAAHHYSAFAEDFIVYHVYLTAGVIYDLHIQPRSRQLPRSQRLILAYRDEAYRDELLAAAPQGEDANAAHFGPKPFEPETVRTLLMGFWINADKSRKVLYRGQDFTGHTGLHLFRQMVARLLFMEQTGEDCGDITRPTIHGLKAASAVLGSALGAELHAMMGMPARNRQEMWAAQQRLHEEVARVGPILSKQYSVEYPAALADVVMANWIAFRDEL